MTGGGLDVIYICVEATWPSCFTTRGSFSQVSPSSSSVKPLHSGALLNILGLPLIKNYAGEKILNAGLPKIFDVGTPVEEPLLQSGSYRNGKLTVKNCLVDYCQA